MKNQPQVKLVELKKNNNLLVSRLLINKFKKQTKQGSDKWKNHIVLKLCNFNASCQKTMNNIHEMNSWKENISQRFHGQPNRFASINAANC